MTEVLPSSPSHFSSPSSSSSSPCEISHQQLPNSPTAQEIEPETEDICVERKERVREGEQVSLIELLADVFRRSMIGCSVGDFGGQEFCNMEIGDPTNVRHVAHVTFDRFNGFLGLPVEFEPEVPRRAPSASTTVFGVSTESMQLSFDSRGNSVPTILLMMQRQLYARGGLQAEGIFRINAENSQEEYVRDQLNRGIIPDDIDVHCLAGLIKAWFRELPTGILDSLSQEQVMQAQSEEECVELARNLPPTEAALLDWAINLMADVAQFEHLNKMNARNVAVVFSPNMTHMSDPLTALMYAVQVMNFLKTLVVRTLQVREESVVDPTLGSRLEPSDENGHQNCSEPSFQENNEEKSKINEEQKVFTAKEPSIDDSPRSSQDDNRAEGECQNLLASIENFPKSRNDQLSDSGFRNVAKRETEQASVRAEGGVEKNKGTNMVGSINPRTELFEAWR